MKRGMNMIRQKKGLSPIITTVLLVVIALVLASVIFMWATGFFKEQISKSGQPIDTICKDMNLQVAVTGANELSINNQGDYPLYKITIRVSGSGTSNKEDKEVDILPGSSGVIISTLQLSGATVEVIPILLGSDTQTGAVKEYSCLSSIVEAQQTS